MESALGDNHIPLFQTGKKRFLIISPFFLRPEQQKIENKKEGNDHKQDAHTATLASLS